MALAVVAYRRHRQAAVVPALVILLCNANAVAWAGATAATQSNVAPTSVYALNLDGHTLEVELAASPAARSRGLMDRSELAEDGGMLFVFPAPRRMSFWMRNTTIPLDIGFFDAAGVLREVYTLAPLEERPVTSRRDDLVYALELNQGWFRQHSVSPGARLDLDDVARALEKL